MNIGIVGSEEAKFTPETKNAAQALIMRLIAIARLSDPDGDVVVVSGHCHLGGVDIWAEDIAHMTGVGMLIYPPATKHWDTGYKPRNILIAEASDIVHCITLKELPASYTGMRFKACYHCHTSDHVKSGGCWTMHYARKIGREGKLHVL